MEKSGKHWQATLLTKAARVGGFSWALAAKAASSTHPAPTSVRPPHDDHIALLQAPSMGARLIASRHFVVARVQARVGNATRPRSLNERSKRPTPWRSCMAVCGKV